MFFNRIEWKTTRSDVVRELAKIYRCNHLMKPFLLAQKMDSQL